MKNKKIFLAVLWALFALIALPVSSFAADAVLVYTEGTVDLRFGNGRREPAIIGDSLRSGDSVITGSLGYAELEREPSMSITVEPDTVFTLEETSDESETRDVLRCAIGSISYRFGKMSGREPYLVTPSAIAGVRGTEVQVTAAEDGSSLFVVQSGLVSVQAEGEEVLLEADEGVEVRPGEAPGEKFEVKRGKIDYSSWREERRSAFLEDPASSAEGVERRLQGFVQKVEEFAPQYAEARRWLDYQREEMKKVGEAQGEEALKEYYRDHVFPLEVQSHNLLITLRYWAKSAFSLRRFVVGRMYLSLKTANIASPENPEYQEFLEVYQRILDLYEEKIVPRLVDADLI